MLLKKLKAKSRELVHDTDGSEALEMCMTTFMLSMFIMIAFTLFAYVFQFTMVSTATKQATRQIEVTGYVDIDRMEDTYNSILGTNLQLANKKIKILENYHNGDKINLMDVFHVQGSCDYTIPLINPAIFKGFTFRCPIIVDVSGVSEVYWSSSMP